MIQETWGVPQLIEEQGERKVHITLQLSGPGWQAQNGVRVVQGEDALSAIAAARLLLLDWAGAVITHHGICPPKRR